MRKSCNRHSSALISLLGGFAITAAVAGTPPHLDSSGVNLQPNYPASALPNAESGSLIVNAEITDTGRVRRLLLLHSTGFDDLDRAGIEALFGWRFIPGLENGKPVPAWAKEQVVFAPPDQEGAPQRNTGPAPTVSAYFPPVISLTGPYGQVSRQTKVIPCSTGTITAKVKFIREKAPYDDPARAGLEVQSGSERAEVSVVADDPVYPPMQALGTRLEKDGERVSGEAFDSMSLLGGETAISLAWDPTGLLTADAHGFGIHTIRMSASPKSFGFFAISASARFSNAQLTCWAEGENPHGSQRQ